MEARHSSPRTQQTVCSMVNSAQDVFTTKGYDHKTPIRTSFGQRFNRYSQLSCMQHDQQCSGCADEDAHPGLEFLWNLQTDHNEAVRAPLSTSDPSLNL